MGEDPIENMRARAEQCRRLSDHIHDREMAAQLRAWAADIDADIQRLEAERQRQAGECEARPYLSPGA